MRVLDDGEAAHVAHHHQDVLVHRVDVEQVVLHLPDDAAEIDQVTAQHAGLVHQAQRVGDALRLLHDGEEQAAVYRIVAPARVHHRAGVVQAAQRTWRQALDARRALVHQERFQDGVGLALVEIVAGDLEHALAFHEALVDDTRHLGFAREQHGLDIEQQHDIELRDRLGRPVITAHQLLAGALVIVLPIAEGLGQRGLQVEHQHVLAASGHQVQARTDGLEQALVAGELLRFALAQQPALEQFLPAVAQAGRLGHPQDHLQVAQAAGAFLAVGLERVGRVLVLGVALAHFQQLGLEEGARVQVGLVARLQLGKQLAVARQQARFQQGRLDRHVLARFADAVVHGAHGGADFKPQVPAQADELLQPGGGVLVGLRWQQQQHIHIGKREQLAAPVAAHRHQRAVVRQAQPAPGFDQRGIDRAPQARQQVADMAVRVEVREHGLLVGFQLIANTGGEDDFRRGVHG